MKGYMIIEVDLYMLGAIICFAIAVTAFSVLMVALVDKE